MKIKVLIAAVAAAIMLLTACSSDYEQDLITNSNDMTINITIDGKTLTTNLFDNSSTRALIEKLHQGNISYTANDYGGFEKVGALGFSLPRNDRDVTTAPGDIILYQGNNLCLYYARNSWDFTPMGKINYQSEDQLRDFLKAGKGQITVILSLPENSAINNVLKDTNQADEHYTLAGIKTKRGAKGIIVTKSGGKTQMRIK